MTEKNERRTGDKTGILFGLTVLTIVGIILIAVITMAFASTEAGPTQGDTSQGEFKTTLTPEELGNLIGSITESKTRPKEATGCEMTVKKVGLAAVTRTLIYYGIDFGKIEIKNFNEVCTPKNLSMDCADCEPSLFDGGWKDVEKLTVRCPLKNGDFEVTIRKK
jgi:hypothetical protein